MKTLFEDLKFSLRLLKKSPAFTLICLIVISLSLAVAISNYSLIRGFRGSLPFENGERYVGLRVFDSKTNEPKDWAYFNGFAFNFLKEKQQSFEYIGAADLNIVNLTTDASTKRYYISNTTPNVLSGTGVTPILGRLISEDDTTFSGQPVVVIGYQIWKREFLNNPAVIGQSVELDGQRHAIIGVMPEEFAYPYPQELWRPLSLNASAPINDAGQLGIVGKLKPGVTREAATVEFNQLLQQLAKEMPQAFNSIEIEVDSMRQVISGGAASVGPLFDALTIVIFLLASLNLSTLLFVRTNERLQELAVRNAMGASAWQLRKQILLESGLLCLVGCVFALGLSALVLNFTQLVLNSAMDALDSPINTDIGIHANSIIYSLLMTLTIWILSSGITAYKISNKRLNPSLENGSKGATNRNRALTMRAIVSVEVVFSFFLLMVCGLINFSLIKSYHLDFGSNATNLYIAKFNFPQDVNSDLDLQNRTYRFLQTELEGQAGITSVSFTNSPAGGWSWPNIYPLAIPERNLRDNEKYPEAITGAVSARFFQDANVRVVSGRYFDESDTISSLPVVIVDKRLANKLWPDSDPIGKQIQLDPVNRGPMLTVVGVNSPIIHGQPLGNFQERYAIYRPITQHAVGFQPYIVLKTNEALAGPELQQLVNNAFAKVDRGIAVDTVEAYENYMTSSLIINDFLGQIFAWFSFVTLCLSVIGVYAIVARGVTLSTKEIGIRRAVGATKAKIIRLFLSQGGLYLFLGVFLGGGAALFISPFMTVLFTDILDGVPFVSGTVLLGLSTLILLACYLPTKQVIAVEPGDALREE